MINLLIKWSYGNWYVMISNSEIDYKFAGATAEDQIENVKMFQNSMTEGFDSVVNNASTMFSNIPEGEEEQVISSMFDATDTLYFNTDLVFAVEGEGALLEDIVEAGEALAAFL